MCELYGEKACNDGRCIPKIELCPEEQLMNQNTILIMIVVGIAVVIFLIVLYCFQQRQRSASRIRLRNQMSLDGGDMDGDRSSLFEPPPAYDEAIDTRLYPPTPQMNRDRLQRPPSEDQPLTPPPNYDTALQILARSHESVFAKPPPLQRQSSTTSSLRRFFSFDMFNSQSPHSNTLVPLGETGSDVTAKHDSPVLQTGNGRSSMPEETLVSIDMNVIDNSNNQESRGDHSDKQDLRGDNSHNINDDVGVLVS